MAGSSNVVRKTNNGTSVSSVTYAGIALTPVVSKATGGGPRDGSASLYQLVAPPSGTAKVVVTLTGSSSSRQ